MQQLRHGAVRTLASSLAGREATDLARSAMEEGVYRLRNPEKGRDPLTPDRPISASIEPVQLTRWLTTGSERCTLEAVTVTQVGRTIEKIGGRTWGMLELRAGALASVGNVTARRTIVRRYGFEVFRAFSSGPSGRRPLFSQVRLTPAPLADVVVP